MLMSTDLHILLQLTHSLLTNVDCQCVLTLRQCGDKTKWYSTDVSGLKMSLTELYVASSEWVIVNIKNLIISLLYFSWKRSAFRRYLQNLHRCRYRLCITGMWSHDHMHQVWETALRVPHMQTVCSEGGSYIQSLTKKWLIPVKKCLSPWNLVICCLHPLRDLNWKFVCYISSNWEHFVSRKLDMKYCSFKRTLTRTIPRPMRQSKHIFRPSVFTFNRPWIYLWKPFALFAINWEAFVSERSHCAMKWQNSLSEPTLVQAPDLWRILSTPHSKLNVFEWGNPECGVWILSVEFWVSIINFGSRP